MRVTEPHNTYALNQKHRKYDKGFQNSGFFFSPLILETTGGIGEEGTKFLKQVFRFASVKQNAVHSAYVGRAWARLSCNLQASVAQGILLRISAWDPTQACGADREAVGDMPSGVGDSTERDAERGERERGREGRDERYGDTSAEREESETRESDPRDRESQGVRECERERDRESEQKDRGEIDQKERARRESESFQTGLAAGNLEGCKLCTSSSFT